MAPNRDRHELGVCVTEQAGHCAGAGGRERRRTRTGSGGANPTAPGHGRWKPCEWTRAGPLRAGEAPLSERDRTEGPPPSGARASRMLLSGAASSRGVTIGAGRDYRGGT